jgi:hypothetical protein
MRITTPSCVLGLVMVWEVFLLKNIAKDWLGFLPLLRRVSQDTSCVLVHGYSSCDLGCSSYGSSMLNSEKIKNASAYHKINMVSEHVLKKTVAQLKKDCLNSYH